MTYSIHSLREAGLEARWIKTTRGPMMVVKDPNGKYPWQRNRWWYVDKTMWNCMLKHGIMEGFDDATVLGDVFSIQG